MMKVIRKREYIVSLKDILSFIAQDSKTRAAEFKSQIDHKIADIPYFPYKYRPSLHHSDESIRDMIHKGYTIIYKIETTKEQILILDIFKWREARH